MVRTLKFAALAALSVVGVARAAELPMTKAAAVDYVRACPAFGVGFFAIPGTDTCLQISADFRADYVVRGGDRFTRADDRIASVKMV